MAPHLPHTCAPTTHSVPSSFSSLSIPAHNPDLLCEPSRGSISWTEAVSLSIRSLHISHYLKEPPAPKWEASLLLLLRRAHSHLDHAQLPPPPWRTCVPPPPSQAWGHFQKCPKGSPRRGGGELSHLCTQLSTPLLREGQGEGRPSPPPHWVPSLIIKQTFAWPWHTTIPATPSRTRCPSSPWSPKPGTPRRAGPEDAACASSSLYHYPRPGAHC